MNNLEEQLNKALLLAIEKHKGQVDKAGAPYILHPLSVMGKVESLEAKIVAILHDILEDTDVTKNDLISLGFEESIVEAVYFLTKPKSFTYMDYICFIKNCGNELSIEVKIADLKHNLDISRLKEPTEQDLSRCERYKKALRILLEDM